MSTLSRPPVLSQMLRSQHSGLGLMQHGYQNYPIRRSVGKSSAIWAVMVSL
jgi:hypothetical protein